MKHKIRLRFKNWKKYVFEFLSVFFAVTFAFLLDRWNENRKERFTEKTILTEIYNGLERDSIDLDNDEKSIKYNIKAVNYFRKIVDNIEVDNDSLPTYYFYLTRDFLTIQNTSGYETLKSIGLEIIENDSLRKTIIDLYEVRYKLHRKFTEEYDENKYMRNYFEKINTSISPNFIYDIRGNITGIKQPLDLNEKEKNLIKSYLWKLEINRLDRESAIKRNKSRIGEVRNYIKENLK
ncbi:hypothetical protein [Psychroserpens luteolus]|uniref:hypothetical protein n=1 Tax=Psychroserpens luteolus TaxID=2855840 RepID=UPI001E4C3345|nr:hypothetical protein [Psychroserpens luteolus]MCD2258137.1 hypothetical protein [Psychroserpens luteolus]